MGGGDKSLRIFPMLGVGEDRLVRGIAQNEWKFEYTVTDGAGRGIGAVSGRRGGALVALWCAKCQTRLGKVLGW